ESLMQDVVVTRETLAFLLEHQDQQPEQPWFVCASYGRPHAPLTAPGRYIRRYQGQVPPAPTPEGASLEPFAQARVHNETEAEALAGREAYYACVDFVDDCIGELLDGLENAGLLDNTIVIYTSDHGEMLGLYDIWGKQLYHEASVAVPLLIALPGGPAGQAVNQPVSLLDLFPTTCALAGLPVPPGLDGFDLSSLVHDPTAPDSPRRFSPSATYRYGVRINHGQTADDAPNAAWRSVQDSRWKYVEVERGARLLFNMEADPLESQNLAGEADQAERCARMRAWLYERFSWDQVHNQLATDRERLPALLSGLPPGTPNQYRLPDGRVFNAEEALYNARWLAIPPGANGGIIPQQFG
ncbi:MAG: sulfatase-like hydrolase/transferase, partial [Anaerolineales bacterium]|nr:sulfatase-like hydrolase/transferase [Anaerolineales bacterium]